MLWFLPGGVAVATLIAVYLSVGRVADEATSLREELGRLRDLRVPVQELQTDARALRGGLPAVLHRTRPELPPAS